MKRKTIILLLILLFSFVPNVLADGETSETKDETNTAGYTIDSSENIVVPTDDTITITLNFPSGWYGQKIQIMYPETVETEDDENSYNTDKEETETILTSVIDGQGKANITVPKNSNPTVKLGSDAPVSSGNIEDTTFTLTDVLKWSFLCFLVGVIGVFAFDSSRVSKWKKRAADDRFDPRLDDF